MSEIYDFGGGLHHLVDLDLLPDKPFVVDAGACVGDFCHAMLEIRPHSLIMAIEPSLRNLPTLLERANGWSGVEVVEKALMGAVRNVDMTDVYGAGNKFYQWSSIYKEMTDKAHSRPEFSREESYAVQGVTLVGLFAKRCIDYLKMDIEGAEREVIAEMTQDSANRISQLSLEHHGDGDFIVSRLRDLGFNVIIGDKGEIYGARNE